MAGSRIPILSKTRINPTLGSGFTILTLAREVETSAVREAALVVQVHGTPTFTSLTGVNVYAWAVAPTGDDPGYDFVIRSSTGTLSPVKLATVTIPLTGYSNLTSNNYWATLAPVNINSTTQQGNFGAHLRIVLEIDASSTPTVDFYLSVDLDVKS